MKPSGYVGLGLVLFGIVSFLLAAVMVIPEWWAIPGVVCLIGGFCIAFYIDKIMKEIYFWMP